MSNYFKGIVAGFIATTVMTLLMFVKNYFGVFTELNVVDVIDNVNTSYFGLPKTAWGAWVVHFITGSVIYGIVFAFFNPKLTESFTFNGIIIGVGAWFVMMLLVFPLIGGGLFATVLGEHARVASLGLHVVYGVVLGYSYGKIGGS
ncbi:MAG: DUF6789 family protein [Chlamydiota bacterium]